MPEINIPKINTAQFQTAETDERELFDKLLQAHGITADQFDLIFADNKISDDELESIGNTQGLSPQQLKDKLIKIRLGRDYGLTGDEIGTVIAASNANRAQLIEMLGSLKAAQGVAAVDDLISQSEMSPQKAISLRAKPLAVLMDIREFILALVQAFAAILRGRQNIQVDDSIGINKAIENQSRVVNQKIEIMTKMAEKSVEQSRMALKTMDDSKKIMLGSGISMAALGGSAVALGALLITVAIAGAFILMPPPLAIGLAIVGIGLIMAGSLMATQGSLSIKDSQRSDMKTWRDDLISVFVDEESKTNTAEENQRIRGEREKARIGIMVAEAVLNSLPGVFTSVAMAAAAGLTTIAGAVIELLKTLVGLPLKLMEAAMDNVPKLLITSIQQALQVATSMAAVVAAVVVAGVNNVVALASALISVATSAAAALIGGGLLSSQEAINKTEDYMNSDEFKTAKANSDARVQTNTAKQIHSAEKDKGRPLTQAEKNDIQTSVQTTENRRLNAKVNRVYLEASMDAAMSMQALQIGLSMGIMVAGGAVSMGMNAAASAVGSVLAKGNEVLTALQSFVSAGQQLTSAITQTGQSLSKDITSLMQKQIDINAAMNQIKLQMIEGDLTSTDALLQQAKDAMVNQKEYRFTIQAQAQDSAHKSLEAMNAIWNAQESNAKAAGIGR